MGRSRALSSDGGMVNELVNSGNNRKRKIEREILAEHKIKVIFRDSIAVDF
jgi:hypothetical protein